MVNRDHGMVWFNGVHDCLVLKDNKRRCGEKEPCDVNVVIVRMVIINRECESFKELQLLLPNQIENEPIG